MTDHGPTAVSRVALALVVFVAFAARWVGLDTESLFIDELMQIKHAGAPLWEVAGRAASQQQPPLDYWLGALVSRFSGSDIALRIPAVTFGALTAGVVVVLCSWVARPSVAVAFGLLLALLPFHVYFSQEVRPYAIAIFLFALLLLIGGRVLAAERSRPWLTAGLGLVAFLLLMSRTLAPLAVIAASLGLCAGLFVHARLRPELVAVQLRNNCARAGLALVLALVCYLPFLVDVLGHGSDYLVDSGDAPWAVAKEFLGAFSFSPMAMAAVAQVEPLEWLILPGALLGAALAWVRPRAAGSDCVRLLCVLLILAAGLHLLVFLGKVRWPFRPPYAIHLLPCLWVMVASAAETALRWAESKFAQRALFPATLLALGALTLTASAYTDLGTWRSKEDWRGLGRHLEARFGKEHVLVLDTLTAFGAWETPFVGAPRYYRGEATVLGMKGLARFVLDPARWSARPVLILHHRPAFFLTGKSRIPVHHADPYGVEIEVAGLRAMDSSLEVTRFKGFTVISVADTDVRLLGGLRRVLDAVLAQLPRDEASVDLLITRGAVAMLCGDRDYGRFFTQASRRLPGKKRRDLVKIARAVVRVIGSVPVGDDVAASDCERRSPT